MNTLFKLLVVTIFLSTVSFAQSWQWARSAGSPDGIYGDVVFGIAVDNNGNSYVTGYYYATAHFGADSITQQGAVDAYIAKYSSIGALVWVKGLGSVKYGEQGTAIAVDGGGHLFVGGTIGDSSLYNGTYIRVTGVIKGFLARFDLDGNLQWLKNGAGVPTQIIPDGSGGCYTSGTSDFFLAKYDGSGTVTWKHASGEYGFVRTNGMGFDDAGNIYMAGVFQGQAVFATDTVKTPSLFDPDVLILKYDNGGTAQWARKAGSAGNTGDNSYSIAVDHDGSFYICGVFAGKIGFEGDTLQSNYANMFIAKYSSTGSPVWERQGMPTASSLGGLASARSLLLDGSGNLFVGGFTASATVVGTDTISGGQAYVAKYSLDGSEAWAKATKPIGFLNIDNVVAMALDNSNNILVGGQYIYQTIFGGDTLTSLGSTDIFVAKLSTVTTAVHELKQVIPTGFSLRQNYPNPFNPSTTIEFTVDKKEHAAVKVFDMLGREVATLYNSTAQPGTMYRMNFDASSLSSGLYYYRVVTESRTETRKMTLIR